MFVRYWRVFALGVCLAGAAPAGEHAILSTGYILRIDRHETQGDKVRLYANGGVTEMPASAVLEFRPEEYVPNPPAPASAAARPQQSPRQLVEAAAKKYGLPPQLVHSIARAESGYNQKAVSKAGALGIMQLMPGTARVLGADPADPAANVDAGTRFLRDLLLKYQDDDYQVRKALAAYNAGPGAVDKYGGVPPYRETIDYVRRVIKQSGLAAAPGRKAE